MEVGHDRVDNWTPAVSKQFQRSLCNIISEKTGKAYKATSINRTMATIRHAGRWLYQQRPLIAGDPLSGVKDLQTDAPEWKGLNSKQLMRLKAACEQRAKICTRKNQNSLLETAVFYILLGTGLRGSEPVLFSTHLNAERAPCTSQHLTYLSPRLLMPPNLIIDEGGRVW